MKVDYTEDRPFEVDFSETQSMPVRFDVVADTLVIEEENSNDT